MPADAVYFAWQASFIRLLPLFCMTTTSQVATDRIGQEWIIQCSRFQRK